MAGRGRLAVSGASTSISNAATSSSVTGRRATRRSLTTVGPNPTHLTFAHLARLVTQTIGLQESRADFRCQNRQRSSEKTQVLGLLEQRRAQGTQGLLLINTGGRHAQDTHHAAVVLMNGRRLADRQPA